MLKLHTTGHIVCVGSLWTVKHTESKIGPSNYMGKSQPSLPGSQQCDARIPTKTKSENQSEIPIQTLIAKVI